ncbi:MAG: hypothetical protein J6K45_00925 [Clostridia bacterium]|nr:hypothetical protein [Clostridia bacterium]
MKKYSLEKFKEKRKNKKMAKLTIITLIAICILVLVALYMANKNFRSFIDTYILRKEISEENASSITIDTENLSLIYAYDNNLAVYADGNINFYNSRAKQVANIEITLSKPIADSEKKYLALGDYDSQKICLVKDNSLVWQKDIEGKVSKISVNQEGYMAVSVTGTTYESIVMLYNPKGELLFSNYLSTYVIGIDISSDHKYLAIAEIDNSKIAPTTKIELVSTDSAISNAEDATVNLYQAGTNEYLSGIKFQNKGNLLCNFDKYVLKLNDTEAKKIYEISDLTAYVDTNMSSDFARVDKEESSVFKSDYRLKISDSAGKEKVYIIEGNLIDIKTKDNKVALNLGNEVLFINNKRMARKKIC